MQDPQGDIQEGQRLMIIELERYNEIGEPLIESGITGSQRYICYQVDTGENLELQQLSAWG